MLFGHQVRNLVFSKCAEDGLREKLRVSELFSKSLSSLAIGGNQDHIRLVFFDIDRQVFITHKIPKLLIVVYLYVEGELSLSALVNKGNAKFCIFKDHRKYPNWLVVLKTRTFVEL